MQTRSHQPWGVRLGTLAIWALAAASAAYWGLRLTARPPGMPAPTAAPAPVAADMQAMARLLSAVTAQTPQAAAAPVSSRFALVGVLAGQQGGSGAALIAVDGKPAKPYRVGATVDAGLVLQSLGPRQARLGAGQEGVTTVTLEMPVRK